MKLRGRRGSCTASASTSVVRLCTVPSLRKSERQYTQSFCVNIHINKEARVCVSMRACVGGRETLILQGINLDSGLYPGLMPRSGLTAPPPPQPLHTHFMLQEEHTNIWRETDLNALQRF